MKKVALIILDGYGISDKMEGNAVKNADTSYFDYLKETFPYTTLDASGRQVGLLDGQMGNSEVGHLNLGAGQIVKQDLTVITEAIETGDFYKNEAILGAFSHAKENNSDIHIMGLCSNGGVHSTIEHMYEILKMAKMQNFERVFIHFFTDGRDTQIDSGLGFAKDTLNQIEQIGVGKVATLSGRYYAMDREKNFDRTQIAYDALVNGKGVYKENLVDAISESYANDVTDEFIVPTVFLEDGKPVGQIKSNDAIIFFNFRADRARQIMTTLTDKNFKEFETKKLENNYYVNFTSYGKYPANIAFPKREIKNTLGEYLAEKGLSQLRIAEETKYAHVTYFFNGGVETPNKNEERKIIEGVKVATFDLAPKMNAQKIEDYILENVDDKKYDFVLINFANCDMLGHTGKFEPTKIAVEFLDEKLRNLVPHFVKNGYDVVVTADHGNAEQLLNDDNSICTTHTLNKVPFIVVTEKDIKLKEGRLSNVSPTVVELMELELPEEYESSLIEK